VKILTVRQPWAWAIFKAGKDVENRSKPTKYRGPLAIHVSQRFVAGEVIGHAGCIRTILGPSDLEMTETMLKQQLGCVIGVVDVIDCILGSASPWAMPGDYHWVVTNPRRVKPVPLIGQQGMFERDLELEYL